ncbi:glucan phosphoethanolaminetransferase (alkaline phosphatase superfamily) [Dysgonomonas sp. PFB1-18]|uniref:phosphoethanolamine transferase n=1 Tax=unclassified Dysgonomonas TaxID=2630389 RepID=UPI002472EDE2|nr:MULTISPECIES: phosphoethanolamine transferase [unclassified Dysgonomonas]MDH6308803.1 glucan phosphoethanolaminetransferase (alkaline phosphatase superfamily) [Dysgonomonas sp. PF1-14]MDH6338500.1 glucan phosphoethanolaminetransferase (alkaline phosphatase superfamily) [Dysgonomonas sp. PF1-16]MDH6380052.1 glucan phosphoethanolaminetransferase (alkaline phosphatase superfamily) [Dysgonomonas sp. PFB1-18]MDH6397328.1 glucan phosphoethanolaminetransferase (alkaline phosphatase superfamily) [Dy
MEFKKYLNEFIDNPVKLFIFFVIVNFLPTAGLLFTEPFDIWGKIALVLFPLGLYFVLYTMLKNIGLTQLLLIPLLIIHAFQIVVFYLFGEGVIAVDMFLNVMTTNVNEAGEVLNGIMASVIFVVVVYVPTIIIAAIACKRKIYLTSKFRKIMFPVGIILLFASSLLCFAAKNKNTGKFELHEDVYPADVFYNLGFARHKWVLSSKYLETSKDFTFNAHKKDSIAQREIYVMVIGETARAENWGLYGYERNTTPQLAKDSNIVLFHDAVTQSNTTHKSVSIMLTAASAENYDIIYRQKSIIEAFKEVGFSTVFLSNQSANRTFTDYFAQDANYTEYYRYFNEKTNNYDEVLLPRLQHYMDSVQGNLFFVLHTYGSHFNYKERYPEEYAVFTPDDAMEITRANKDYLVNAYDNTILYTDNFLHNVIKILGQSNSCSAMFYTSDHGEDILDDNRQRFLHASPTPTYYQLRVPMLMWFSPAYNEVYPQAIANAEKNESKPIASNAVFHTILDMANIDTEYQNPDLSLLNPDFKIATRMYLDDHDDPIPFYNTGLKKEDMIMMEKRKIQR